MFKYILVGIIIYGIYRFSIKGNLKAGQEEASIKEAKDKDVDDDYIEYEEID